MKLNSILKKIIVEASRYATLKDKLTTPQPDKEGKKQKPKLTVDEFVQLAQADPTINFREVDPNTEDSEQLDRVSGGAFLQWIVKNYLMPKTERAPEDFGYQREVEQLKRVFLEDLDSLNTDLKKFEKFKARLPQDKRDINKIDPEELNMLVRDFSLEKTKTTKKEREEIASTYSHPGGDVIFRGPKWTVIKISKGDDLGKDAACFYGGHKLKPEKGETDWCTSSPGLDFFKTYIKDGPLYVIIPNDWAGKRGEKSGLPAERYQFHFPTNQFKDVHNRANIDLIQYLNGPMKELKHVLKPEFAKGLVINGKKLKIDDLRHGNVGMYIALYGLDDLIQSLPDDLEDITIQNRGSDSNIDIKLPENIDRFKNLQIIYMFNCISEIPESVCNLPKLRFLTLLNNPNLKTIPACLVNCPNLILINLKGSTNVVVPDEIKKAAGTDFGGESTGVYDFNR